MIKKITLKTALVLLWIFATLACGRHENLTAPASEETATESASILPIADTTTVKNTEPSSDDAVADVWVCQSAGAKRYHSNPECGGLKRCKHDIIKQSIKEAEAVGLTQCGFKKCR